MKILSRGKLQAWMMVGVLLSFFLPITPSSAHAMDRDLRAVLISGVYGVAGGTALGLLSYPATRDLRGVFIGSSIGLYLGFAVGIYHILHRDDPGNPISGSRNFDLRNAEERRVAFARGPGDLQPQPLFRASVDIYRF